MAEAGLDTLVSCSNLVDWGTHQGGSGGSGLDHGVVPKKSQSKKSKPFECGFCPKRFALKVTCKVHERVHTGEKPFQCKTCSRSFAQMSTLTAHVRIHSGEKPYQCRICLKRFRQRSQLTQHERGVHATTKPFSCDLCDKKFALKSLLKQHLGVHQRRLEQEYRRKFLRPEEQHAPERKKPEIPIHNRYAYAGTNFQQWKKKPIHSCPQCGRQFNHEGSFRRHERVHTGEQPYQCRVCGRKFADISSLRRHVKKLHPEALAAHTYRAPRVKTEYNYGRPHGDRVKVEYPYGRSAINHEGGYYGMKPPPPPSPPPPPPPLMGGMTHFQQFQQPYGGMSPQAQAAQFQQAQQPQQQQYQPQAQQYWGASYAQPQTVEANIVTVTADYPQQQQQQPQQQQPQQQNPQKFMLCQGACVEDGRPMVECAACRNWFHYACVQYLPTSVQPPPQKPEGPAVAGITGFSQPGPTSAEIGASPTSTSDPQADGSSAAVAPVAQSPTSQMEGSVVPQGDHTNALQEQEQQAPNAMPQPITPTYAVGQAPFYCPSCRYYPQQIIQQGHDMGLNATGMGQHVAADQSQLGVHMQGGNQAPGMMHPQDAAADPSMMNNQFLAKPEEIPPPPPISDIPMEDPEASAPPPPPPPITDLGVDPTGQHLGTLRPNTSGSESVIVGNVGTPRGPEDGSHMHGMSVSMVTDMPLPASSSSPHTVQQSSIVDVNIVDAPSHGIREQQQQPPLGDMQQPHHHELQQLSTAVEVGGVDGGEPHEGNTSGQMMEDVGGSAEDLMSALVKKE